MNALPVRPYGYRSLQQTDIARLQRLLRIEPLETVVSQDCYAVTFTVGHHGKDAGDWAYLMASFGYDVRMFDTFIVARAVRA